jgi:RNA polymerase sigma-70 factor (ECF subfamily)
MTQSGSAVHRKKEKGWWRTYKMVVSIAVTTSAEPTNEASRRAQLDALFTLHAAQVFAFARRRASHSEADDVVSETFLVAWRRLDAVPDHALPWLLGVARRVLANRRRAESRQSALRSRLAPGEGQVVEVPELANSETRFVLLALADLPPAERDAITLLAWEGLTPAEAAIVLGCSRATFYVRVHRARRRLAGRLGARIDSSSTKELG